MTLERQTHAHTHTIPKATKKLLALNMLFTVVYYVYLTSATENNTKCAHIHSCMPREDLNLNTEYKMRCYCLQSHVFSHHDEFLSSICSINVILKGFLSLVLSFPVS